WSACWRAASVPMRASSRRRGALPGRKPGRRTSLAILRKAASTASSNSAAVTSTLSLTRLFSRGSTVACIRTGSLPGEAGIPSRVSAPAAVPEPPYVAVIFTSQRAAGGDAAYAAAADAMEALAARQPGYLGIESARDADGFGITVSYWATEADAK